METNRMHPRGITKIADLRARSTVDPVTGCWHWQGAKSTDGTPRIHAFDHDRGEKLTLSGPKAVWNIAHGESPAPGLAFRACVCTDCVNPVHMRKAQDKAEIGLHIRRSGRRKGTAVEARRVNIAKAQVATGRVPTPTEKVLAIRSAPETVTNRSLARQLALSEQVVSKIRRGQAHRHLLETNA